jgi:NADPH:quinone reductase-like Zn-dependent oxidoreductase
VSIPATMRALQQTSLKGPQDMRVITDAPVPSPGQGQVLIRVAAAGVNFADISRANGTFPGGPQPPYLAGFEAAGQVVAAGEAVTSPRSETGVAGVGYGAFAEYMVLPAADSPAGAGPGRELAHRTWRWSWCATYASERPSASLDPGRPRACCHGQETSVVDGESLTISRRSPRLRHARS